eukprot:3567175-Amphidinium_carterae.1
METWADKALLHLSLCSIRHTRREDLATAGFSLTHIAHMKLLTKTCSSFCSVAGGQQPGAGHLALRAIVLRLVLHSIITSLSHSLLYKLNALEFGVRMARLLQERKQDLAHLA